jgi:hypothetical protein
VSITSLALGKALGTGVKPVPVHHFGGRAVFGSSALVLDLDPAGASILFFDGAELRKVLRLGIDKIKIDPYGIALDADRRFHLLGNRGRVEVTVDMERGSVVGVTDLEVVCLGIWNVGHEILLAPLRADVGQSVLVRAGLGKLHSFGMLTSRSGRTPVDNAIANLFFCGGGEGARLTCWWGAGEAAVLVLEGSGTDRRVAVPSLASRSAFSTSKGLGSGFVFPVRDVFLVDEDAMWVLTNQEGALTPVESGAVRARHLFRVGSRAATIPLVREARAILLASRAQVTVLYVDGSLETISSP